MRGQEAFGLALASALVKGPLRAEVFAFHTALVPLTATLARLPRGEAPPLEDPGWAGGTRIGESLERYLEGPGRGLRRESHVMIWSDGWETGDPERLERALRRLIRRAGRVDWLDPLAHTPGYAPVTRGMQAARRVVRTFVPMADAEDLDRYARLLAKGG
jgi:uncharacterized protein with von Willebrand factor type A (vWA) domain